MNDKRKWSELNLEERNAELRRLCDVYKGIKQITDQLNAPKTWSELNPKDAKYLESSPRRDCFPRTDIPRAIFQTKRLTAEELYEWADGEATLERNYGTT